MSADHPRACGENSLVSEIEHGALGSPPRMRGKLAAKDRLKAAERITPAHAGKTIKQVYSPFENADHPRACGENKYAEILTNLDAGSPPRMRGKLAQSRSRLSMRRITPAHAGKTR